MKREISTPISKRIFILIALAILGGAIIYFISNPDIDKVVKQTNQRLEYSIIQYAPSSFIMPNPEERKPLRSLIITIDDKYKEEVVHFEVMKYIINTDKSGSINKIPKPIKDLYAAIQQVYNKENKLIDAIGEVEISADFAKRFKVSTKLKALAEVLYSIQRFAEIRTNSIDIYIRGYADGQLSDWSRLLEQDYNDHQYKRFKVNPRSNPNSNKLAQFYRHSVDIFVPDEYGNKHLPNLRARFIQLDYIEPYIKQHLLTQGVPNKNISIGILDGHEFEHHNSLDRKVEIYVNIY